MKEATGKQTIIIEWALLILSLIFVLTRLYIRFFTKRTSLNTSDTFVIVGWIDALALVCCDSISYSLGAMDDNSTVFDSVSELYDKVAFASVFFFDVGLYLPKASLVAFYWQLIPSGFGGQRLALKAITVFTAAAAVATFGVDMFWCAPRISDNWSRPDICSVYADIRTSWINWTLNIFSDVLVFVLPFFLLPRIRINKAQKWGVAGAFLLGVITMAVSTARFVMMNVSDAVTTLYITTTAELTCAIIVVCLPSLRPLLNTAKTSLVQTIKSTIASAFKSSPCTDWSTSSTSPLKKHRSLSFTFYGHEDGKHDDMKSRDSHYTGPLSVIPDDPDDPLPPPPKSINASYGADVPLYGVTHTYQVTGAGKKMDRGDSRRDSSTIKAKDWDEGRFAGTLVMIPDDPEAPLPAPTAAHIENVVGGRDRKNGKLSSERDERRMSERWSRLVGSGLWSRYGSDERSSTEKSGFYEA